MMRFLRALLAVSALLAAALATAADEPLTLEQVIAKHLASIGNPQTVTTVKTRVAEGKSKFEVVNGGGSLEGKATIVSQAGSSRFVLKYPNPDYPGEDMLTDGNKVQVYGRPQRSALGFFMYNQCEALLTEGIFSGTLSTAWPLLDPKRRSAKLTYHGLKSINGQLLHEVQYEPKKRTDLDIRLYFSKDDYRHVLTVAKITLSPRLIRNVQDPDPSVLVPPPPPLGGPDVANASQQQIRYRLEQRFSNFAQFDGMTFPTSYQIRYDLEGQRQAHHLYTMTFTDVVNNISLNPKNFEIK